MKVYSYNRAVAKQGRPSILRPSARYIGGADRGMDQAFLISEQKRIYVAQGKGLFTLAANRIEEVAFEKYAPLRDIRLLMVVAVEKCRRRKQMNDLLVVCDLYDYHEKVILHGQKLVIPSSYVGVKKIWRSFEKFDNELVDPEKLAINKEHAELVEEEERRALRARLFSDLFLLIASVGLGLFMARVFFIVGVCVEFKMIKDFRALLKSPYATKRSEAYAFAASLVLLVVCVAFIIQTCVMISADV